MGRADHEIGARQVGSGPSAGGQSAAVGSQEAMNYLKARVNGHGGIILLDAQGQFGLAHNTPRMAWALKTTKREHAGITR